MSNQINPIVLVTGSSRGIGKAIALQLANDGFDIFVHCRVTVEKANEVVAQIEKVGRRAYLLQGDVTKEEDVKNIFSNISQVTDGLDILVNNAGFDHGYMIEDYTLDQMRYVMDTILLSRMATTKYALPLLKRSNRPQIINIASRMGKEKTIETVGAYAPAMAGIIKFTQCCALEFRKYKIRANCVVPGFTDTELNRGIYKDRIFWDEMARNNPSGRIGLPQDVANVVSFLASEKANYINAATIDVNGGSNLG
jgi:3-oxoacyl-[acyl-carrier protein] reductase